MPIHPPKRETFDVEAYTNTDPKGIVRAVDVYAEQPWGLYMARPTPGRRQFHYLESWLLPSLGLRATIFHFNPGFERVQDYYLDVGRFTRNGAVWTAEDHYLDLVVRSGVETLITDVVEFTAAVAEGLIDTETADEALSTAFAAVDGLASHDHDLDRWLASREMVLTWRAA